MSRDLRAAACADSAVPQAYGRALALFVAWRGGVEQEIERALREAPDFVMAHVLRASLCMTSRDPRRVQAARPIIERARRLAANECERLHVDAITAVLDDDYEHAKALLGELLELQPLDMLALQMVHSLDYVTGDVDRLRDRVASVLPAWSCDRPGYHAVLAMHGFSLQESGEYALAEKAARAALDLNPLDARAHHVMAHVFEMTERPAEGLRWMLAHAAQWDGDTLVATHCWWHVELFHLSVGDAPGALAGYERHIRPRIGRRASIGALIDGAALLWRLRLRGRSVPSLWAELAEGWSAHIDDGFCSFNDIHAMLAFVGAADAGRVARLEAVLLRNEPLATRYGETTRQLGLPACRALMACGRADFIDTIRLLSALPAFVHRIGGSHAQRDVLHLTLLSAVEHIRRPPPSADKRRARTAWCEGTAAPARRTARQTPPETSMMAPVE